MADRVNKRRLLYLTQAAGGILALVLGVLVVTHTVELWQVYLLAAALGDGQRLRQPRPARPSSWRWSGATTCPTRSASTPWS